ncbi:uncharacterized protein LOC129788972 [Lutzomyia longipalpis]|uniref:uncharacterized protein LOC129788972 n=1 Tax=Lutzomyia longipalpis TaxID=7200 RepID=UPI00248416C6|nr:uncharacterized protein LOC129788972 [Lutzomyia longipalpis]
MIKYLISPLAVIILIIPLIQNGNSLSIVQCPYGNSECLVKMYDSLIRELADGNEEYNISPLDPIFIEELVFKTQLGGPLDVQCVFKNANYYGFRNSTTKKFKGFPKDFDGVDNEIYLYTPKFILSGNYVVNGTFIGTPMMIAGFSTVTFLNVNTRLRFISRKIEKNGDIFAKVEKMRLAVKFDRMIVKHNVSDPSYKLIADVAVEYINANWKDLFNSIKESAYKAFGKIWEDIFNQITTKIPYKNFFKMDKMDKEIDDKITRMRGEKEAFQSEYKKVEDLLDVLQEELDKAHLTERFFAAFSLEKCDYGDSKCIIKLLQSFIDNFWDGKKEIELPHLDPLKIKNATLVQEGRGAINFVLQFRDFDFIGYRDSKILDARGWPENFDGTIAEMSVKAPKFTLIGPYTINGNLLLLPIQGSGTSNVTLNNLVGRMKFRLKKVIKDGEVYASAEKLKLNINISRMYMEFENLFNGNPELEQYAKQFLNENWKLVFEDIKPSAMKTFGQIWQDILNHVLSRIPVKEFFNSS